MGKNLMNIYIHKADGSLVPIANRRTATDISSASQNWSLNAEDTVSITVVSPFPQTYDIGDKITIFGRDYKLNRLPKVKKTGMHEFQYDLEFEGVQYDLFRVTYDLTIDTTSNQLQDVQGDTLTGNLHRFMTVLVANANRVFPGKWMLGACPETEGDKTLTFGESDNCLSVLQNLCGESNFNVEFEIEKSNDVYKINLYEKVGQTLPYTFKYGRGRGLYDLTRENVSSANIVTRLKVYGSTENITSKYRADRLCLPGKNKGESYIEKADMVAKYGIFEGRKNFDDIKPSYTGTITSVVSGNVLQFIDTNFPFDLNEMEDDGETTKYLLSGVSAKIHFNTGNLAGYEFEVHSYDHATHKFTLVKQTDERGNVFPSETSQAFQFGVGNEYKVLDIAYPSSIEQAAESKLAEEGNKYYDQNCQPKVQYGLKVTKEWLQKLVGSDETVTNVFQPGDYLHIVDGDIGVDKSVRIRSLERNILDPYEYDLTISDTVTTQVTNRVISDLVEIDKIIEINNLKNPARARANWRTSREILNMVFDPDGDYYTDKIKPQSIDTMALAVGAKSMQFGLLNTVFQPNYNGNANVVKWQGGVLTHYTIRDDSAVSWTMADGSVTLSNNQAYYLYAKCERSGNAGTFIFSTSQIKVEQDANHYHFLVGTISSIDPELKVRSLALTYGFTMVNGRFIKTGRIESTDGLTYFDLDKSEIGGKIKFISSDGSEKDISYLETLIGDDNVVFTTQPKPPYKKGDIWINGKIIQKCNNSRESGSFVASDWVEAVEYDKTQTIIDGGIVTSGTIQVAGNTTNVLAGMTGNGTLSSSVRFWAGKNFANRAAAPFRVLQNGKAVMTDAEVHGQIFAESGEFSGSIKVTGSNIVVISPASQIAVKGYINSSKYSHIEAYYAASYTVDDAAIAGAILKIYFPPILTKMPSDTFRFPDGIVDINEPVSSDFYTVFHYVECSSLQRGAYVELLRIDGGDYSWMVISKTDYISIH